ncbi:hypothetical protein [Rathayibacter toxicus]|uniref:LuxE/PaaK family acyltransferase n=1 Tax=Rathayibacter toxicus TaxID=145458 RepID=UPI00143189BB|nr:hypothetical protein [Rathayibacter toxicus]QOD07438.1 hypothetical protein AYW78_05805 [Rathayibacter toxicus]QOD09538.1 hypothetical protein BSG36_05990 [Rathayibacter toxicus]
MPEEKILPEDDSPVSSLDVWLSEDDVFRADWDVTRRRRLETIRAAFDYHIDRNACFRDFARLRGFEVENLTENTLGSVPLIPAGLFKRFSEGVRTGSDPAVMTTSSGTQGTVSHVPRDNVTINRFFASVTAATQELLDIGHSETRVRNIGPRVDDVQHLWISYVMAGVSVLHDTDFFVHHGVFDQDSFLASLADDRNDVPSLIVGPPALLWDLAEAIDRPLPPNKERRIVTIGGWKRREGERVDRYLFDAKVGSALGVPDALYIRDAFNMVELNSVLIECSEKKKHCPPWVYASARDPHTMHELNDGAGLLGYVDPTPTSFPGAVLSEDFGWIDRDIDCPCGIRGDVVRIDRRVNRLESRGCAMKI